MPIVDGKIQQHQICNSAVVERTISSGSVSSLKIAASLESDNYVGGSAGWKIERDTGSAEFQDVTVRGSLNADDIDAGTLSVDRLAADSITVDKLSAGTIGTHIIKLSNSASSRIESNNGTSLIIRGDGSAVFTNISVTGGSVDGDTVGTGIAAGNITTGTLNADRIGASSIVAGKLNVTSLDAITANMGTLNVDDVLTMTGSTGKIRTGSSGERIELYDSAGSAFLDMYDGTASTAGGFQVVSGIFVWKSAEDDSHTYEGSSIELQESAGASPAVQMLAGSSATATTVVYDFLTGSAGSSSPRTFSSLMALTRGGQIVAGQFGSASAPTWTFITELDTGMYHYGTNALGLTNGGTVRMRWDTSNTAWQFNSSELRDVNRVLAAYGTAGAPPFSFNNDANTGMGRIATDAGFLSAGGDAVIRWQVAGANQGTGVRDKGALHVYANDQNLGGTAGNNVIGASFGFDVGDNAGELRVEALRDATGTTYTTAAMGIRRIIDTTGQGSLWFANAGIGINTSGPAKVLHVAGTFALQPGSGSGTNAHLVSLGGSDYELVLDTSILAHKKHVKDVPELADLTLRPISYTRRGTDHKLLGFAADHLEEQDTRLAVYNFDGDLENYSDRGVMAVMAAKINRLERQVRDLTS